MLKKYFFIVLSFIIAFLVIKQSLILRNFNYDVYPTPGLDEYNYVWQAISLRKTGLPLAWTLNSGEYKNPKYQPVAGNVEGFSINSFDQKKFQYQKSPLSAVKELDYGKGMEQILFVAPFFDHPPIGGLVYELGMPKNIEEIEQVKPSDFRKSAIVLAVITSVLLYILLFLVFGNPWVPLLSTIIYSTVPTYILATRTAYLENVVSPLALLSLIFLYLAINYFVQKRKLFFINLFIVLSGLFGGLSVLAKEPAIGFLVGFFILLVINKTPIKSMLLFVLSAFLPVFIYILWGFWLQKNLFLGIFFTNAGRSYFGAIKMVTQLEALKFKNFPVDGWWIWGLVSFLIISLKTKSKKILFLTIPLLAHLLTVLFMPSPNYPWYLLSCIPFLAACSAVFIWQIIKNPSWASALAFFFIPFSSSYYWGRAALNLNPSISHYSYIFVIFIVFLFIRLKLTKFKIIHDLWFLFLFFLIYRVFIYNQVSFPYLMAHWSSLPVPSLPNF